MSLNFNFNKIISLDDIKKTEIRVIDKTNHKYLTHPNGDVAACVSLDDDTNKIIGICSYGIQNPYNILHMLVENFNIQFIGDDEMDIFIHEENISTNKLYHLGMLSNGYSYDKKNDKYILQQTDEDLEYLRQNLYLSGEIDDEDLSIDIY